MSIWIIANWPSGNPYKFHTLSISVLINTMHRHTTTGRTVRCGMSLCICVMVGCGLWPMVEHQNNSNWWRTLVKNWLSYSHSERLNSTDNSINHLWFSDGQSGRSLLFTVVCPCMPFHSFSFFLLYVHFRVCVCRQAPPQPPMHCCRSLQSTISFNFL